MDRAYVHGYDHRENIRLQDQASTLVELLQSDTSCPAGSRMRYVRCPDVGVECLGSGEVKLKVEVIRRENLGGAVSRVAMSKRMRSKSKKGDPNDRKKSIVKPF
jgi:hypothetical protein